MPTFCWMLKRFGKALYTTQAHFMQGMLQNAYDTTTYHLFKVHGNVCVPCWLMCHCGALPRTNDSSGYWCSIFCCIVNDGHRHTPGQMALQSLGKMTGNLPWKNDRQPALCRAGCLSFFLRTGDFSSLHNQAALSSTWYHWAWRRLSWWFNEFNRSFWRTTIYVFLVGRDEHFHAVFCQLSNVWLNPNVRAITLPGCWNRCCWATGLMWDY